MTLPASITDLDSGLAIDRAEPFTEAEVESLIIEAVYRHQAADVGRAINELEPAMIPPAARELTDRVIATCEAISLWNHAQRDRIAARLRDAGLDVGVPEPKKAPRNEQVHQFVLMVDPRQVAKALTVLRDDGFLCPGAWRDGALQSLVRSRVQASLVKSDQVTTRLILRWRDPGKGGRFRRFQPSDSDYACIRLPGLLWPVYHAIKAARIGTRQLTGGRAAEDWGPFLGTPEELIPALLSVAGVNARDTIVDLGCGDGRVLVEAAQRFGCNAHGVEQDSELVAAARSRVAARLLGDAVSIERGNFLHTDLRRFSVVFLFLPMRKVAELMPSIRQQLAPGARIVMHEQVPLAAGLTPDRSSVCTSDCSLTVAHQWRT